MFVLLICGVCYIYLMFFFNFFLIMYYFVISNYVFGFYVEKPSHGKLSEYSTVNDYVTYVPNPGKNLFACIINRISSNLSVLSFGVYSYIC